MNRNLSETLEMYEYYKAGMSLAQIGAKYHYNPETIWKRFKVAGLKMRAQGARRGRAS